MHDHDHDHSNCGHDHGHHHAPQTPYLAGEKVGRNDPCTCGSSKKYKKCCMAEQTANA